MVRICGACVGFAAFVLADWLGLTEVTRLSPVLGGLAALALGAGIAATAYGAWLWYLLGTLCSITIIAGGTPIMRASATHFVRRDSVSQPVDAVVVLSGAMTEDGLISGPAIARFVSGIAEARRQRVSTVALSVIDNGDARHLVTSEADQRALMNVLAPDITVLFVRGVKSTHDEALQFAALANTHRWRRVALVTSPLHTRRSCGVVEKVGLAVQCVPGQPREYALTLAGGVHARLNVFRDVMYETAATLLYSLRGWI